MWHGCKRKSLLSVDIPRLMHSNSCYGLALHQTVKESDPVLNDVTLAEELLPDTTVYWVAYPISREPIPLHANLLFKYRNDIAKFNFELLRMRPDQRRATDDDSWEDVKDLARRLKLWYEQLPECLQYRPDRPLPYGIVELQ